MGAGSVVDGTLAESQAQATAIWRVREGVTEALQRRGGWGLVLALQAMLGCCGIHQGEGMVGEHLLHDFKMREWWGLMKKEALHSLECTESMRVLSVTTLRLQLQL